MFLVDVDVLIALFWPSHVHHADAHRWFVKRIKAGWATCSLTQASFVRIASNPSFSKDAAKPSEAVRALAANVRHPQHHFLADDVGFVALVEPLLERMIGHRQVSDAYLVGLARHHDARVATFDRGLTSLLNEDKTSQALVEVIPVST